MIVVNLDVMMAKRKISLTELSEQLGMTMANVSNFKNHRAKAFRFTTLDALCRILQCQPGDILEYREDKDLESENKDEKAMSSSYDIAIIGLGPSGSVLAQLLSKNIKLLLLIKTLWRKDLRNPVVDCFLLMHRQH